MANDIEFSEIITKGANGDVLIGENKILGRKVVVKFYYWAGGLHAEPAHLARLASDSVLPVLDAASLDQDYAYFVTPYCEAGDVDDMLVHRKVGPREAVDVALQVAEGVSYLHGMGYLHRDLKPSNIFLADTGRFVIGDFGSVVVVGENGYAETKSKHSLIYRPPEDFDGGKFYRQGDVYQLGLFLFQILGGALPYSERDWLNDKQIGQYDQLNGFEQQDYARTIISRKITLGKIVDVGGLPPWVPKNLRKIVKRATNRVRTKRYETVADLMAALNNVRGRVTDWRLGDGVLAVSKGGRRYRITQTASGEVVVEKRVTANWRVERGLAGLSMAAAIAAIEELIA